jgi:hypothetical protein
VLSLTASLRQLRALETGCRHAGTQSDRARINVRPMHEQALRAYHASRGAGLDIPAPPAQPNFAGVIGWWSAAVAAVADRLPVGRMNGRPVAAAQAAARDGRPALASEAAQREHTRLAYLLTVQSDANAALEARMQDMQAELDRLRAERASLTLDLRCEHGAPPCFEL